MEDPAVSKLCFHINSQDGVSIFLGVCFLTMWGPQILMLYRNWSSSPSSKINGTCWVPQRMNTQPHDLNGHWMERSSQTWGKKTKHGESWWFSKGSGDKPFDCREVSTNHWIIFQTNCSKQYQRFDLLFFPHIFVWGSCFWFCIPPPPAAFLLPPLVLPTTCPRTTCHHTIAHAQLAHTQLAHTHNLCVTQLVLTPLVLTHHLSSHHLLPHNLTCHHITCHHTTCPHTTCSRTTCHHTTCSPTTCHHTTCSHTTCPHTTWPHTTCPAACPPHSSHTTCPQTTCCHLLTHNLPTHKLATHNLSSHNSLCVAGVALGDIDCHFAWQAWHFWAWHLATSIVVSRGRSGTWWHRLSLCVAGVPLTALGRLWWHTGFPNDAVDAAALCVAGVALGDIDFHFAWQAWHLVTSTITSHNLSSHNLLKHNSTHTWWHRLLLYVAGVPLTALGRLWWRTVDAAALCVAGVALGDIDFQPGRRGTWWHRLSLCVEGVPLPALGRLWWRTGFPNDAVDAAAVCVAGLALGDIDRHMAWQGWRLVTSMLTLRGRGGTYGTGPALVAHRVPKWRRGRRGSLRGRRGTWWHWLSFWWPAWHLVTSRFTLRGRRGTWWHRLSPHTTCHHTTCSHTTLLHNLSSHNLLKHNSTHTWWHRLLLRVAGVPLTALGRLWWRTGIPLTPWTPRLFAWQAWHLVTSTFTLRGRRGTWWLADIDFQCVRRGTWWHRLSLCVEGVPLTAYGTGPALVAHRVPKWRRGRRGCLRGRRGTWRHRPSLCVAGVALGDIDAHFAWQAWHLRHWAGSGSAPGSQMTPWTPRLFAWQAWHLVTLTFILVACVALGDIAFHFAWWAWHLVTSTITSHNLSSHNLLTHTQLAHTQLYSTTCHHTTCSNTTQLTLGDIDYYFAWQACHLRHWAGSGGAPGSHWRRGRRGSLRGRRGTWWHRLSLCVAGVALGDLVTSTFSVAGVALGDIDYHFAWKACHFRHWAGSGGAPVPKWRRGRRGCLRGRRGTWRHRPSLCVASVALGDIDAHFAWQAWHLRHSAGSGGAPGSQMTLWTPRLFAWQAWHLVTLTFIPHIFVWGSCFWFCTPAFSCPPPPPAASSSFRSNTTCHHTTCSHTHTPCPHQLVLTHLAHTQLVTTQIVTTHLPHTQLVTTQLTHT